MKQRISRNGPQGQSAGILALILCFAACSVDDSAEIAVYRGVLDEGIQESGPSDSLALLEALRFANKNNETLAAKGEEYLRALIARQQTFTSFLPTVQLTPALILRDPVSAGSPVSDQDISQNVRSNNQQGAVSFDLSADLRLPVFNGFRDIHRYWRDSFRIKQREQELLAFQESLLLDVARAYYQALRSEASLRVLENSLLTQEERLRNTRGRYLAGLARPLDVAQSEAQTAATRVSLVNAKRDVANARSMLALLTGIAVPAELRLTDNFTAGDIGSLDTYLLLAGKRRREIAAAEAAVQAAEQEVEVAFGQYIPGISINFSSFLSKQTAPTEREWDGILSANIPLFSAGQIHADVREACSFLRQAVLVRSYRYRQIEQEVRQGYQDLLASRTRLSELTLQLQAADQTFRQAEASYRAGLATNLDRVSAQDGLLFAQLQTASERFESQIRYLQLIRVAGALRPFVETGRTDATGSESGK